MGRDEAYSYRRGHRVLVGEGRVAFVTGHRAANFRTGSALASWQAWRDQRETRTARQTVIFITG